MAEKARPLRRVDVPDEFFTVVSLFVPALNALAQKCDTDFGSLLVLFHIQISGKQTEFGQTILRQDLTSLLTRRGFSDAGVSRVLANLQRGPKLVQRVVLKQDDRERFGPGGNVGAVAITDQGIEKIAEFKSRLRGHFESWLSRQSWQRQTWLKALLKPGTKLARELIEWATSLENKL